MLDEKATGLARQTIADVGLLHPIMVTPDDRLIASQRRLAACKIAGVEPKVRHLDGEDPLAFVDSTELRRHVTPGQRAMGYAMRHPKPEKGGRGKKLAGNGEFSGVPHQRVSEARTVLAYSRELAEAVIRDGKPLQAALAEARLSQGSARNERARLATLRDERPDLAELVSTDGMSIASGRRP